MDTNDGAGTFYWTGGTPTASVSAGSATNSGLYIDSPASSGDGFQITVHADTTTKTLKLYAGCSL